MPLASPSLTPSTAAVVSFAVTLAGGVVRLGSEVTARLLRERVRPTALLGFAAVYSDATVTVASRVPALVVDQERRLGSGKVDFLTCPLAIRKREVAV